VQHTHEARVTRLLAPGDAPKTRALVAVETAESPFFRCVYTPWRASGEAGAELAQDAAHHLHLTPGAKVWVLPID
jgi:hypothetical protein